MCGGPRGWGSPPEGQGDGAGTRVWKPSHAHTSLLRVETVLGHPVVLVASHGDGLLDSPA